MTRSTETARTASVHNRSSTSSETTSAFGMRPGYDFRASLHAVREPGVGDDDESDDDDPEHAERERPELEVGQHPGHGGSPNIPVGKRGTRASRSSGIFGTATGRSPGSP